MERNALIVGCGIVGSVIARQLAERGYSVVMWDRREHIGGNMYDYIDGHGIRVHKYGPHIFHTNDERVYEFICQYGYWEPYKLVCGAMIDDICTPTAFNFESIDSYFSKEKAEDIKKHIGMIFKDRKEATVVEMLECHDELICEYAQFLFDKDYSLYTAKQWGISPKEIDISVLKRVPIRFSYEKAYFSDKYQVMPKNGYTEFIGNILNHSNIEVKLNVEALKHLKIDCNVLCIDGKEVNYPVIYTGAVDELFGFMDGHLPYRSLRFEWKFEDKDSIQIMPVVAYPQASGFTRITEYKKLPVQNVRGTSYAVEYPIPYDVNQTGMEPYYPVLTEESQRIYQKYMERIRKIKNLYCCGRLGDFKYYDMDKAIGSAFGLLERERF